MIFLQIEFTVETILGYFLICSFGIIIYSQLRGPPDWTINHVKDLCIYVDCEHVSGVHTIKTSAEPISGRGRAESLPKSTSDTETRDRPWVSFNWKINNFDCQCYYTQQVPTHVDADKTLHLAVSSSSLHELRFVHRITWTPCCSCNIITT